MYVMIQVHNTIHTTTYILCRVSQSSWYCTVPTRHQRWYGAWVGTMIGRDQKLKFILNISVTAENFDADTLLVSTFLYCTSSLQVFARAPGACCSHEAALLE